MSLYTDDLLPAVRAGLEKPDAPTGRSGERSK